ncbi:MAG: DUF4340 domain-containing protein [Opitutales bacterium]|nr:DUF4340 domain-containing protein [Opitutales bacterium]
MNLKIVLIILNSILIAWIYINLDDQDQSNTTDEFTSVGNLDGLKEIKLLKPSQNLLLSKERFSWKIKEPIEWEVDEFSITNFITVFSHLDFNKLFDYEEITERGERLSDYGINSDSITLHLSKSSHVIKIKIGNLTRDKRYVYCELQLNENPNIEIWRISNELVDLVETPFNEWADSNLIRMNLHQVQNITASIKLNNTTLNTTNLFKNDTGEWEFELPFRTNANNENVRLLLNRLLSIKVTDFNIIENKDTDSHPKLEDWKFKLVLKSNNLNHEFFFCDENKSDKQSTYLCKTNYTDHIIKLDDTFKSTLSDWSTKLRERKIFRLKNESIQNIVISGPDVDIKHIRSTNNTWKTETNFKEGFESDVVKIQDFLNYLNLMEIKEFISLETDKSDVDFNLENKSVYKIQITTNDTDVKTILIQNNQIDATLTKIFMVEESLLCLVEEDWSKIYNIKAYEFKKRSVLMDSLITNVQITSYDSNNSIYNSENNTTFELPSALKNLEVQSFVNDKSSTDGTWLKGDWVPWVYVINIEYSNRSKSVLFLSEKFSENQWLGSLINDNHTFNLPVSLIQKLSKITN